MFSHNPSRICRLRTHPQEVPSLHRIPDGMDDMYFHMPANDCPTPALLYMSGHHYSSWSRLVTHGFSTWPYLILPNFIQQLSSNLPNSTLPKKSDIHTELKVDCFNFRVVSSKGHELFDDSVFWWLGHAAWVWILRSGRCARVNRVCANLDHWRMSLPHLLGDHERSVS